MRPLAAELPGENDDAESAARGFVGGPESLVIQDHDGGVVWDMDAYGFLRDAGAEPPDTVHPSLWRHARIDTQPGLYEVADGVFQVRGYDVSNMTLVEGERGVIVVDPLISIECARSALELYYEHRGERPVTGVVYSHSHGDHFGGVRGVLDRADGKVPIWAPERFLIEAVSENVLAGNAMMRRGGFMFGNFLERSPRGQLGSGIGWTTSDGNVSLAPPTDEVTRTGQSEELDGVRFVFQLVPETEAPAELNFHLPERRALYVAEIATHTHHNVLTLRGAQVRDALGWSKYLNEAIELFADESEVLFHGHHWPTWGRAELVGFLKAHRDLYRYIHDQTLRLMNRGLTPHRDRLGGGAAAQRRRPLVLPRLLRDCQPQRARRLPALPRLLRRCPGAPRPGSAGRGRRADTSTSPGASTRCSPRPARHSSAATTGGAAELAHPRLRRPRACGGARTRGRRPRAARLPVRERDLAQLPARRGRSSFATACRRRARVIAAGRDIGTEPAGGHGLRRHGLASERPAGRRPEAGRQLGLHRHRRAVGDDSRTRRSPRSKAGSTTTPM